MDEITATSSNKSNAHDEHENISFECTTHIPMFMKLCQDMYEVGFITFNIYTTS